MSVAELPLRHPTSCSRATRHPFLVGVRDGSLPGPAFNTWLAQDYRFVADLLRFQSRLLARAPRRAQPVLVNGASALVEELAWFERQASEKSISLTAPLLPAAVVYADLLDDLDRAEVPLALAMLWTIERTYLDAWSFAAPGHAAYGSSSVTGPTPRSPPTSTPWPSRRTPPVQPALTSTTASGR